MISFGDDFTKNVLYTVWLFFKTFWYIFVPLLMLVAFKLIAEEMIYQRKKKKQREELVEDIAKGIKRSNGS